MNIIVYMYIFNVFYKLIWWLSVAGMDGLYLNLLEIILYALNICLALWWRSNIIKYYKELRFEARKSVYYT